MNVYYAKTALYAFASLEEIAVQIDELVEKKALSSMCDFSSALSQCEKILNYTTQKDALFALKIRIEEVLSNFSEDDLDCLDYKYFKKKPKEYYVGFDYESRAYFRKQARLIEKVAILLEENGTTDKWFEENCMCMDFFKELFKRTVEHEKSYCKKGLPRPRTMKNVKIERRLSA